MNNTENLDENIPGCEDNYYRFVMMVLRISRGWIDFFSTLALMAAAIISSLAAGSKDNQQLTLQLNIATAIITGIGASLRVLKEFTVSDETQSRQYLQQIIRQYNNSQEHHNEEHVS